MKTNTNHKINLIAPIIVSAVAIAVIIVICIILVNINSNNIEDEIREAINSGVLEKDYSPLMKLSKELIGQKVFLDDAEEKFSNEEDLYDFYVTENNGYIADKSSSERITFDIIIEEADAPPTLIDFVYHETIGDNDSFVMKSSENTFQHFNGYVTNEFNNIDEALRDHLIVRED